MANIDILDSQPLESRSGTGRASKGLVASFCLAIFLSASLLFSVQPMFTKLILPLLGGSANVWNTAMVFFQAMLLGGYIYAWAVSRFLPFRAQIIVHLLVTAVGFLFLPLAVAQGWTPPEGAMPTGWLLALFGASVGMPFFALSANAPLLQRWFSYTDHPDAADPYFLYAVSNIGSLLVLCAYPVVIEPYVVLSGQTQGWSFVYYGLWAAILVAGVYASTRLGPLARNAQAVQDSPEPRSKPLGFRRVAMWTGLAFIPSSLMLGVTTYVSSNIASAPFLWIVPLVLYLLTFIIAFGGNRRVTSAKLATPAVFAVVAAMFSLIGFGPQILRIVVQLASVFVITLYMHVRLVEDRPDASHLTQFYIFMSLGGVLGGAFNALAAPIIFNAVLEYPLVLTIALVFVGMTLHWNRDGRDYRFAAIAIVAALLAALLIAIVQDSVVLACLIFAIGSIFALKALRLDVRLLIAIPSVVATLALTHVIHMDGVYMERSFFSTLKVDVSGEGEEMIHSFVHGDTVHNIQLRDPAFQNIPLAYFGFGGTFDHALTAARTDVSDMSVTVVGLGAGALACHEQPGEDWIYMEIDPMVVEMARDPELFSFLEACSPDADIRIGDARIKMDTIADASQNMIIIDAFSSDAIPAHLITREAMQIYQSKLTEDGVIFFHTSNRMLDVGSVVITTARAEGLASRYIRVDKVEGPHSEHIKPSTGVLVGSAERISAITGDEDWKDVEPSARVRPWTDDYTSIVGPLLANALDGEVTER